MERKGRKKSEKQNRQGHADMSAGIYGRHCEKKKPEIKKILKLIYVN